MILNVLERILLQTMIKTALKQGSLVEMMNVEHILKKITFTEDEITEYNLKSLDNGSITWNPQTVRELEISVTKEQTEILGKVVEYYDTNKQIEMNMLSLIIKIKELSNEEISN